MDAQRSGAGLELGAPSEDGGYTVVAPLPGSPVSSTTDPLQGFVLFTLTSIKGESIAGTDRAGE